MQIKGRVEGADQLIASLRNIAEKVQDKSRKTMHRAADKIVERAKLFTPHDTGDLEDSIEQRIDYEDRSRLAIEIVGGEGLDYAAEVDQNYSHMHPGPGTIAKMEANPGILIGEDFLGRAVDEQRQKLPEEIFQVVVQTMNAGR